MLTRRGFMGALAAVIAAPQMLLRLRKPVEPVDWNVMPAGVVDLPPRPGFRRIWCDVCNPSPSRISLDETMGPQVCEECSRLGARVFSGTVITKGTVLELRRRVEQARYDWEHPQARVS